MKLLLDNYDNLVHINVTIHDLTLDKEIKVHTKINAKMIRPNITRKAIYPIVRGEGYHSNDIYCIHFGDRGAISVWIKPPKDMDKDDGIYIHNDPDWLGHITG